LLLSRYLPIFFFTLVIITGCNKKESGENPSPVNSFNNPVYLNAKVKEVIKDDPKFLMRGYFRSDSLKDIAAGTEIANKKDWGIKFFLLQINKDSLEKKYESPLLNGSFKDSKVEKKKFSGTDHDFIYYNSQDYFMGSGGGEIIAYIIDLQAEKVYYAHLISEPEGKSLLYLSFKDQPEIAKFLKDTFKQDFPTYTIIAKDPVTY
jgi:hypothetical protein